MGIKEALRGKKGYLPHFSWKKCFIMLIKKSYRTFRFWFTWNFIPNAEFIRFTKPCFWPSKKFQGFIYRFARYHIAKTLTADILATLFCIVRLQKWTLWPRECFWRTSYFFHKINIFANFWCTVLLKKCIGFHQNTDFITKNKDFLHFSKNRYSQLNQTKFLRMS